MFECPLLVLCTPCPSKAVAFIWARQADFSALNLIHVNKPWICRLLLCVGGKKPNNLCPPSRSQTFCHDKWALMWGTCVFPLHRCLHPSIIWIYLPSAPPLLLSAFIWHWVLEASWFSDSGKQTDSSVCHSIPKAESSQWLFIRTKSLTQISTQQTLITCCQEGEKAWERGWMRGNWH